MNPKIISIVTPSYNQGQFIEKTIQSVLSQEGEFYIDYIVIDGNSTDESVEIIKKYEHLLKANCKVLEKDGLKFYVKDKKFFQWNNCLGISYRWKSERDNGQVEAVNKGFNIAKGHIFAFLNSDDVYYRDVFKEISGTHWKGADFVYGQGMWISETGEDILSYPTFKPSKYNFFYQCTLCQPTVFFTRDAFFELGDFSMDYPDAFDYEYWLRALFNNKKFLYINAFLAKSRMYIENKSLFQRRDVSEQVKALNGKYYNPAKQKLDKIKLLVSKYRVQRKTVSSVNKLQKYLGTGIRYRFWLKG
ncbi:MAG: glycosyltransferase [Candidatus Aminicenantes bacterium]|nr:MAG: glycosyltransferase [Candidatus Aminicenantes bacterium]